MDGAGLSQDIPGTGPLSREGAPRGADNKGLVLQFESLGGSGHGSEFGTFQHRLGANPDGLLTWADLGADLLIGALESRLDGVGLEENTIVFAPNHSDEWWTRDRRYWMAMRSYIKIDEAGVEQATAERCRRLQSLRQTLIGDLEAGQKIFVFKNLRPNLADAEIERLHAAMLRFGAPPLLYVRGSSESHPAGTVVSASPGLLVGYADTEPVGVPDPIWLTLCEQAARLYRRQPAEPIATMAPPVATQPVQAPIPNPAASVPPRRPKTQRGRQIVLIGNCQMQAMVGLYNRFVAGRSGDVMQHVLSYRDLTDETRDTIQQADLVVEQLFDLKPQADTDGLATTTPRLYIPMVTAAFLWPFAGSPHPKNGSYPFLAGGPYGGEAADSYLNRLLLAGTDPEAAVETYANLDVNKRVNLDRLFEIVMDRQRSRDEAAGYQIADVMEQHFRTEQIFLSPYHPNVRIATSLASQFFARLGATSDEIERMKHCTRLTPFPKGELPFHPSVCRHFGLEFVAPDQRYRFMNEGMFTFREYALRYMRYEWNDALEEGMHLTHVGKLAEARERLTDAVARSPGSAAAYNALGHVLAKQSAPDEALAALRRAVEIEPDAAAYRANLGNLLRQNRHLDEALTELRAAVAIDPVEPHYRVLLAHLLRQLGSIAEACGQLREAVALDPNSAKLRLDLADSLEASGDADGAIEAIRDALARAPSDETVLHRLAHLLGRLKRFDEAVAVAREAVTLAPESTSSHVVLSDLLLRNGEPTDALNEAYVTAVAQPDNAHAYGHLGHVLYVTEDLPAAEAAFRRAAKLDPRNAHFRHEISLVLHHQQRFDEAVAAAREATALEPGNPHRFAHLAGMLAQKGDLTAAQAAQRGAVSLDPEVVAFRLVLSDLLARDRQFDEALAEASIAVDYQPASVRALGHLAHVAELKGAFERADDALRRALAIDPRNDYLQSRVVALRTRAGWAVAESAEAATIRPDI